MLFFVISVLLVNIILWIVFLVRFKNLFSTDGIIEKTEQKMNQFVHEIDLAADRDTYLAKETTNRIKSLLEEADRKMELFKEATSRLRDMIAEADRINKGKSYINPALTKPKIDPDSAYEVNIKAEQGSLFDQSEPAKPEKKADTYKPPVKPIQKNETNVTEDGAAYHEIPLIITKVYDEEPKTMTPEEIKKNMNHLVRKMFDEGKSVEEIAKKLNCSITEIQFIIDLL
ncbi:MAG: hypothetical protein J5726_05050 [Treponema sp.]|nr:hypothetical protein [Treponema sp.]